MELKDKTIDIFGTKFKLRIVDKVTYNNDEIFGLSDPYSKTIYVARTCKGIKQPKAEMELTLVHELMHAIFNTGQYLSESDNEALVEWCARCIYQCLKSNVL